MSFYKIRVKGHLDGRWSEWFDGLVISNVEGGEVVLSGEIVDQAALHGALSKMRTLNLPLIALDESIRTSKNPLPGQRSTLIRRPLRTLHKGVNDDDTETIRRFVSARTSAAGGR